MNIGSMIIDDAFEKEIGISIHSALNFLVKEGISIDDMITISDETKKTVTNAVNKKDIPYEYRFLLINIILCTMFKNAAAFHNEYMKSSEHTSEHIEKKWFNTVFVKER